MFWMISRALCDDAVFGFSNVTLVSSFFISYIIVSFINEELFTSNARLRTRLALSRRNSISEL
jgi:formate/nitrite transporter FocA (FNT family)